MIATVPNPTERAPSAARALARELELDVMASLAAAEGLLAVAMRQLAEAAPIYEAPAAAFSANGNGRCSQ